ncbi:MAG: hypothetical protein LC803_16695 [Acidobacteria bacterium]|nr:hypothetical protein [Acidobacteriota bacterium]
MLRAKWFALLALLVITAVTAACTPGLRAVGRGIETGAVEGRREIASMQKAGEIEEGTAKKYSAVFDEVESNGHNMSLIGNWGAMSRAEKRRTVLQQISLCEASARRLDEAGVVGIKSTRARKRVEDFKRNFQRSLGALRIIEASIPAEQ